VPAKFKDRVPRIERFEQGDAWVIEGVTDPINFGMNAAAGLDPEQQKGWVRFEDIRRGGYDPNARLQEMAKDGVDAEILYPTPACRRVWRPTPTPSCTWRWCAPTTTGSANSPRWRGQIRGPRHAANCGGAEAVAEIHRCGVDPGSADFS